MDRTRILVVDDDPIVVMETGDYLEAQGFEVVRADSAGDALSAIEEHPHFAALVTDIDLGDGTDGFGVARCLRAVYPNMPIVFISGSEWARREAEQVAAAAFISKPFRPQQVATALAREAGAFA